MDHQVCESDWDFILSALPDGWQKAFREKKILKFGRKFGGPAPEETFLRVMFMHLACGYSFRTTAARAREEKIVDITDVTLFHHFEKCAPFFEWCNEQIMHENRLHYRDLFKDGRCWKAVDGTIVREQGETGSLHRIHYAVDLGKISSSQVIITSFKEGESLSRFEVNPGDVFEADRGFAKAPGLAHVIEHGGDVLCRFTPAYLKLFNSNGSRFEIKKSLAALHPGDIFDQRVCFVHNDKKYFGRVCAIKRSEQSSLREKEHIERQAQLKGRKASDDSLFLSKYLLIFTTLENNEFSEKNIVRAYRLRWQIEMVFKRLKSLLELGQLHKYKNESIRAFLSGKILIALLLEKMIYQAEAFSPF